MVTEGFDIEDYSGRCKKIKEYEKMGWLNAEKDVDPLIRMKYYKHNGYTKAALHDAFHAIRYSAYEALGWSKSALNDPCDYIKNKAYLNV